MGAHADMTDHALFLLLFDVGQKFSLHDAVKFRLLIHEMNHSEIDIIGLKACKQIGKGFLHLIHISGAHILAVLPGGAEVSLDDPFFPSSLQGVSDIGTDIGFGHPAVQNIDSKAFAAVDDRFYLFRIVPFQPLRAEPDLAHLQACFPQFSVPHDFSRPPFPPSGGIF